MAPLLPGPQALVRQVIAGEGQIAPVVRVEVGARKGPPGCSARPRLRRGGVHRQADSRRGIPGRPVRRDLQEVWRLDGPVIYLTGGGGSSARTAGTRIGLMVQPGNSMHNQIPHFFCHAADTGCFKGNFDPDYWLEWLDTKIPSDRCLFATAPDVLGDPVATWERSAPFLAVIRDLGFPAALVAQDGLVDPPWETFDCLFVGGTDNWKLTEGAYQLAAEAKRRGKWTHLGRVNSRKRYLAAKASGFYDSADGNFVGFAPIDNLRQVEDWLTIGQAQPSLWEPT